MLCGGPPARPPEETHHATPHAQVEDPPRRGHALRTALRRFVRDRRRSARSGEHRRKRAHRHLEHQQRRTLHDLRDQGRTRQRHDLAERLGRAPRATGRPRDHRGLRERRGSRTEGGLEAGPRVRRRKQPHQGQPRPRADPGLELSGGGFLPPDDWLASGLTGWLDCYTRRASCAPFAFLATRRGLPPAERGFCAHLVLI
ncbi:hypothetical protein PSP6_810014 [Paraburkholderia tropica]|nr:hypothetical protein PSP6_810014 [Paraburkholderia tropica]